MSVAYGGAPGGAGSPGAGGYQVPGRVNFGWISEAFEIFKVNAGIWIVATLALIFVPGIFGFIIGLVFGAAGAAAGAGSTGGFGSSPFSSGLPIATQLVVQAFTLAYQAFLYGGLYGMAVKQVRGEPISFNDIFSGGRYFLPMLGFQILYALAVAFGFLLLIVPGLLVASLMIPTYAQIADGVSFSDAISRSIDGMKRDMWNGIAFLFVMGLVILVSLIPCGLGVFVTYPMLWIVSALAYRDMVGMPGPSTPYGMGAAAAPGVWPPAPGVWPPAPGAGAPPPQWGSTPGQPQGYPGTPPQPYSAPPPSAEQPRRSLSGDPLDNPDQNSSGQNHPGQNNPGQTPPGQGV